MIACTIDNQKSVYYQSDEFGRKLVHSPEIHVYANSEGKTVDARLFFNCKIGRRSTGSVGNNNAPENFDKLKEIKRFNNAKEGI